MSRKKTTSLIRTDEAVAAFLAAKTAAGLSERTLGPYAYRLRVFCRVHDGALPVDAAALERFIGTMGPSSESRDTYFRLLRNLYNWLDRRGLIAGSPMGAVETPRLSRKVARVLTPGEFRQLFLCAQRTIDRAFLLLLADTGMRLSEAFSVNAFSFDGRGMVSVDGKTGQREVPISGEVESIVKQELPWPWSSREAAGLAVRKAFRRAGIKGTRASAHTPRHTFVRLWAGDESVLVDLMGWTSPKMLAVYKPFNRDRATEQHHRYSPLRTLNGPSVLQLPML